MKLIKIIILSFYRSDMTSKYEKAIQQHIPWLKEQIVASKNGEINVKVKILAKEMGEEFVKLTDIAIYSRLRDILLEHGIKVEMTHVTGNIKDKILIMRMADESEIISARDAVHMRAINVAKKRGYTSTTEYRNEMNHEMGRFSAYSDNSECPTYFGQYIEEKYVSQIFDHPVPFEFPKDELGRITDNHKPYDYLCKKGLKIKMVSSVCHTSPSKVSKVTGDMLPYFEYAIRKNSVPDYYILSAWDNRESLDPLFVWIIKSNEIFITTQSRKLFWDRENLSISFNENGIKKMKQYEANDKLDKLKEICGRYEEQ